MAKLIVICGHGAGDPGACGNGFEEAERVRVLGKRIKELGGNNVILEDINRNFYKDNGISHLTHPKDYQIIELHMDSASASARGAHVIIDAGMTEDKYDKALANFLIGLLPGRSQSIVKRNNLANPARALAAGYGYRLVEIGFISNAEDVAIFNANIDTIAKGILACFDNPADDAEVPQPKPQPTPTPAPQPTASAKYKVGTPVCTCRIWESSTDTGAGYTGDWQANITRVSAGARHPYLIGDSIGWTDDASIDGDPHTPGASTSKPSASTGSSAKYGVGTLVCTNTLATSSTGGKVYKGDWSGKITRVIPGAPYPYLLNDGTGWTNDAGIDSDPHTPR